MGRVSGYDAYVSKKTMQTVNQLYLDCKRVMLQVECVSPEEFEDGENVVAIGDLTAFQGQFRLRNASVRRLHPADNDYFAGADIAMVGAGLVSVGVGDGASGAARAGRKPGDVKPDAG